jgi:peptidoglycan/LPS O-acetylase OafA/YrhL
MLNPVSLRSARVDFLRGIAILSVLLLHFSLTYRLTSAPLSEVLPLSWIRAVVINGNYGVTMFFVISGFLITSNNLQRFGTLSAVRARQFYAYRFARIIPPLALALAVIVPLGLLHAPSFDNVMHGQPMAPSYFWIASLSVLTFWHNVLMEVAGYFNYCLNIYWSLSVEEVFYLCFPLACLLLKRRRLIAALCLAAIVVAPWYRHRHADDELYFMYGYAACFDAIAMGCLTAMLYSRIDIRGRAGRWVRGAAAVGLTVTYLAGIDGHEVFGFTGVALFTALLLFNAFDDDRPRRGLPFRWVAWLGRHSYELYLFHIIVLGAIRDLIPKESLPAVYKLPLLAVFLALSALVAFCIARGFADPLNRYLRRRLASGGEKKSAGLKPADAARD